MEPLYCVPGTVSGMCMISLEFRELKIFVQGHTAIKQIHVLGILPSSVWWEKGSGEVMMRDFFFF